jgi:hypothetical protein
VFLLQEDAAFLISFLLRCAEDLQWGDRFDICVNDFWHMLQE